MTYQELQDRFFKITDAIELSAGTEYFSTGQRICLHQERASVMRAMEELYDETIAYNNHPDNEGIPPHVIKTSYSIPQHLNEKLEQLINNQPQ